MSSGVDLRLCFCFAYCMLHCVAFYPLGKLKSNAHTWPMPWSASVTLRPWAGSVFIFDTPRMILTCSSEWDPSVTNTVIQHWAFAALIHNWSFVFLSGPAPYSQLSPLTFPALIHPLEFTVHSLNSAAPLWLANSSFSRGKDVSVLYFLLYYLNESPAVVIQCPVIRFVLELRLSRQELRSYDWVWLNFNPIFQDHR